MAKNAPRTLSLDLTVHFGQDVGNIHALRISNIRDATLRALDDAIEAEFPGTSSTIQAHLSFGYIWRDESHIYPAGEDKGEAPKD